MNAGLVGTLMALAAAAVFVAAASDAAPVARYGGAAWIFILTWIILMPMLAPWLRRRRTG